MEFGTRTCEQCGADYPHVPRSRSRRCLPCRRPDSVRRSQDRACGRGDDVVVNAARAVVGPAHGATEFPAELLAKSTSELLDEALHGHAVRAVAELDEMRPSQRSIALKHLSAARGEVAGSDKRRYSRIIVRIPGIDDDLSSFSQSELDAEIAKLQAERDRRTT